MDGLKRKNQEKKRLRCTHGRLKNMSLVAVMAIISICLPGNIYGSQETQPVPKDLNSIIIQAAERHHVEAELIMAMVMVESGYNTTAVSDSGALGLMQLMPKTAQALGVEDCFDPEENINGGVRYFQRLKKRFKGNIVLALAAYHAGPTRVRRCGGIQELGGTKQYIMRVMEFYQHYKKNYRADIIDQ